MYGKLRRNRERKSLEEGDSEWERRTRRVDQFANFQDNYLLEIRGDVNSSLDPSNPQDETMDDETAADSNKVYYVVHPQVDLSDLSSSLPGV
jgi:DNA replication licensing factor MCM6